MPAKPCSPASVPATRSFSAETEGVLRIANTSPGNWSRDSPAQDHSLPNSLKSSDLDLANNLHGALPALSLPSMVGFTTAFVNDDEPEYAFAQQVVAFGKPGDILLGISTSGKLEKHPSRSQGSPSSRFDHHRTDRDKPAANSASILRHHDPSPRQLMCPGSRNCTCPCTIPFVKSLKTPSSPDHGSFDGFGEAARKLRDPWPTSLATLISSKGGKASACGRKRT